MRKAPGLFGVLTLFLLALFAVFGLIGLQKVQAQFADVMKYVYVGEYPAKPDSLPIGHVDEATADGNIRGWALDPNTAGYHNEVHIYFDGPVGQSNIVVGGGTTQDRCDVRYRKDINDCGFDYGFSIPIPNSLKDGKNHKAYVYSLDMTSQFSPSGKFSLLGNSPLVFNFGGGTDVRHTKGILISHLGTIYYVGESARYPFPSMDVFLTWGLSLNDVVPANPGDLKLPIGAIIGYNYFDGTTLSTGR